jgi:hypothetical protein
MPGTISAYTCAASPAGGHTSMILISMVNSIYNGSRFEDVWLDR